MDYWADSFPFTYVLAAVTGFLVLWVQSETVKLRHIPTVGTSWPILSYINGLSYMKSAQRWIHKGYNEYSARGGIFKVARPDQWHVLISNPELIDELRKMPEEVSSLRDGLGEILAARHVFGEMFTYDPVHVPIIYNKLAHTVGEKFHDVKDEIWAGFESEIGSCENWKPVKALDCMTRIVMRNTHRVYVGLPLCRDPTYLSLVNAYRADKFDARAIVNLYPNYLKGLVARWVTSEARGVRQVYTLLAPMLTERRKQMESLSKLQEAWPDKPNDMITWLLEDAIPKGYSNELVTFYLLMAETAAIHTTSLTFVHALYYLATYPDFASVLRDEVEFTLSQEGGEWTRSVVNKLYKMDSLLRESQRLNGINMTTLWRRTVKPITFSNGVTIPSNTLLSATTMASQVDEDNYDDPDTFNPWRFVQSKSFVTTGVDYLPFGHGRHACPGRHFAANEIKLMMAYIVLKYDIALEPARNGVRPEDHYIGNTCFPNSTARVMFRKRSSK